MWMTPDGSTLYLAAGARGPAAARAAVQRLALRAHALGVRARGPGGEPLPLFGALDEGRRWVLVTRRAGPRLFRVAAVRALPVQAREYEAFELEDEQHAADAVVRWFAGPVPLVTGAPGRLAALAAKQGNALSDKQVALKLVGFTYHVTAKGGNTYVGKADNAAQVADRLGEHLAGIRHFVSPKLDYVVRLGAVYARPGKNGGRVTDVEAALIRQAVKHGRRPVGNDKSTQPWDVGRGGLRVRHRGTAARPPGVRPVRAAAGSTYETFPLGAAPAGPPP